MSRSVSITHHRKPQVLGLNADLGPYVFDRTANASLVAAGVLKHLIGMLCVLKTRIRTFVQM